MEKHIINSTSLFEVDNNFQDERFMKVRITAMHSGINRNNSRFDIKVIKDAKDTFSNIPILAEVKEFTDKDGNKHLDYTSHAMHIEEDAFNEGESRIIYDEAVVGIVPETNNFEIIHDDETGNDYVLVDALLFREYGNYCCDILEERGGKTDVSAEIACEEVAFSAKDKCLDVGKMKMCAITLLGEDIKPGMEKAHAEVFSSKEEDRTSQLIQIMQELKESLDNYTNTSRKEDPIVADKIKEENFENEEVVENEDVENVEETAEEEVTTEEEFSEEATEVTPDEEVVEESVEENFEEENKIEFSATIDGEVKTFSISLNDKLNAIYSLVNETYGELDNDFYEVIAYEDTKTVEMHGVFTGKSYRQNYKVKKDCYSLVGDRCEIFSVWMSEDEKSAFENMKANYSSISEKLQKYEEEPQKMEILKSQKYGYIAGTEEFAELESNHFDMSIEEVTNKANEILLSYADKGALKFSVENETEPKVANQKLPVINNKSSRYGNLFSK